MRNLGEFFTGCAVAIHTLTGTYLAKRNGEMYSRNRRVATATQRPSFKRIERPMVVTERSGLTRAQAIHAINAARKASGEMTTQPQAQEDR